MNDRQDFLRVCSTCLELKDSGAFPQRGNRCLACRRAKIRDHYQQNRSYYVAKARKRRIETIGEVREWMAAYLVEHPCIDCGETDIRVLEFDHEDPPTRTGLWRCWPEAASASAECRQRSKSATCGARTATVEGPTHNEVGGVPSLPRNGAPGEIRTPSLLIRSQMLYPLSYGRMTPRGQGDTLPASSQGQKLHRTRGENGGGGGI